jgi:gamma-glutamylcyclotransferase (GGCT)/AIG2-like uncharacterized protein YtfP
MIHRLFIYGSLLPNCRNHIRLHGGTPVGPAHTAPKYRLLDLVDYPGLAEHGMTAVAGELYDVEDKLLAVLDLFEGVPHLFGRRPVELAPAAGAGAQSAQAYLTRAPTAPTPRSSPQEIGESAMRIVLPDDFVAEGEDALGVVASLKAHAFVPASTSLAAYMAFIERAVAEVYAIRLDVQGTTDAERAASLIAAIVRHGLALELPDAAE